MRKESVGKSLSAVASLVDAADGSRNLLLLDEAGLEGLKGGFVIAPRRGDGLQRDLAAAVHDIFEKLVSVFQFLAGLKRHPHAEARESRMIEISGHAEIGVSGAQFQVELIIEHLFNFGRKFHSGHGKAVPPSWQGVHFTFLRGRSQS